jgi:hypothetical protein
LRVRRQHRRMARTTNETAPRRDFDCRKISWLAGPKPACI